MSKAQALSPCRSVPRLLEKALATAHRLYALVQGHIVLEAPTSEGNLPHRLEEAYFGDLTQAPASNSSFPSQEVDPSLD